MGVLFLLSGYPAARRCHSSVQVRQGNNFTSQFNRNQLCVQAMDWESVFNLLFLPPQRCFYVGVTMEGLQVDHWKVNLQTFQWTKLLSVMPEPAYFHCAAVTPAGCMYVHGGVENRRTGSLSVWLVVPSLLEITWEKLLKAFRHLAQLSPQQLLGLGLTHTLIQRLK
ncbi:kelch domain-containing protein 10 isoform X1 [Coregonus clupeaformis]|nr:kelch domain-containing protein 10 isoform X1 [Coregonus clupeaformis]XP_045060925.1 kelch domain-containing protein 10 isoform X1 [Coregonus clupeaformis]XP_045060926.1 kelch domain-containing protein 10 isoform X1 [Coregonus clupeaformis]XP_045060927.1 kelch domain-containing protein 10 isoform X1 [Coregonus clupeaformis]